MKNWSIFEQLTPDFVQNPDQIHEIVIIFFVSCPVSAKILVKSLRGCEKWILQKILHRYSDSKIFSTFFFRPKKYFLNLKKKLIIDFFLVRKKIFLTKSLPKIFVFRKIFSIFQRKIFSTEKKKLRKISIHYIDVKFSEESIFRIFRAV